MIPFLVFTTLAVVPSYAPTPSSIAPLNSSRSSLAPYAITNPEFFASSESLPSKISWYSEPFNKFANSFLFMFLIFKNYQNTK